MSVDFTHGGYVAPGTYIQEETTPFVTVTGLPPVLIAIVGPSLGFQTNTEQFTLSTVGTALNKQGVDVVSVVVTRVDTGAVLTASDYTKSTIPAIPVDQNFVTDIIRTSSGGTLTGDTPVYVTYNYLSPRYFDPLTFDNFEDVKAVYGQPLNPVSRVAGDPNYKAILSPLSLAAQIAFENGAGQIRLVATTPANTSTGKRSALSAAYAKVLSDYNTSVIVPITEGISNSDAANVANDLHVALSNAATNGFLMVGMLGFDTTVTTPPDALIASGFSDKRIALAYAGPGGLNYYNGETNQTLTLGHQYLAAAYAGTYGVISVQKALTHEVLSSFAGLAGTPLSNSLKNQYAAAGVAVTEVNRVGQLWIRHGISTNMSNVATRELSVTRARDAMVVMLQNGLDSANLIGQPIDENTPLSIKAVVAGVLEFAVAGATIVAYTSLQVRQTSLDPSVIEVQFAYRPAYPLNYVMVNFSVDVSTGSTDLTNVATS